MRIKICMKITRYADKVGCTWVNAASFRCDFKGSPFTVVTSPDIFNPRYYCGLLVRTNSFLIDRSSECSMIDLYSRFRLYVLLHACTHTRAHTQTHAQAHTHTHKYAHKRTHTHVTSYSVAHIERPQSRCRW